jgi:hypothetical protein
MCKIKHAGKYKELNLSIDQPATNLLAHACPLLAAEPSLSISVLARWFARISKALII